jgi:hypothetical protein
MKIKVDPVKHQYGNFIVVEGHDLPEETKKEVSQLLDYQINETFAECEKLPTIKRWESKKWMHHGFIEGREYYLDSNENGICEPVTLFLWKSIPGRLHRRDNKQRA